MTVVLGGGISGLSAAYYAANEARLASVTLLEASDRVGGWIRSRRSPSGAIFEQGPRTVRPHGPAGMNTLDMIDDLQLTHKLIRINASHPIAQNRLIYSEQALHMLPMSLKGLFKTISLLDRPLVNCLWTDLKAPKVSKEDESIYSFVQRRLGRDIADRLISPIICGVCAGDARQISVNFMMKSLFEAEQKHGSIVKGFLAKKLKKVFSRSKSKETKEARAINDATMGRVVQLEKLAIWSLEGGLEQLPLALADNLEKRGVTMETGTKCERLTFKADRVELSASGDVREYSRVISSLPAKSLAELLQEQHPELSAELRAIPSVTVAVVNLEYPGDVLPLQAFGFLIPPEENLPLLGVIFDSCMVPKESATSTVCTLFFPRSRLDFVHVAIHKARHSSVFFICHTYTTGVNNHDGRRVVRETLRAESDGGTAVKDGGRRSEGYLIHHGGTRSAPRSRPEGLYSAARGGSRSTCETYPRLHFHAQHPPGTVWLLIRRGGNQ
ncbi:PREDICTED: protoporphyrinogen oxidase isoform X1 [Dinoponera quadriceps]|uniref:Protoporphyrinogen oxidase n=1 Tax=Dinoponera quadriceps TaxID=609295 RepID=A0A6P3WVG5_DINQU|nr:PREDICTED: protoporphyrinogen oxidase isoform X1 [Dinoponera quadriceps]XP_014470082.1 PREDICTED: protoporphyrinogen oxidase isoform X1 [Dinoponera quadriceps]